MAAVSEVHLSKLVLDEPDNSNCFCSNYKHWAKDQYLG